MQARGGFFILNSSKNKKWQFKRCFQSVIIDLDLNENLFYKSIISVQIAKISTNKVRLQGLT